MLVTALEAQVSDERVSALTAAYRDATRGPMPPGLMRSVLLRHSADPTRWRIETTWASSEALAAMRGTGTPRGILIFRAAGAEPTLTILDVVEELQPPGVSGNPDG